MFLFGGATLIWGLAWLTPLGRHITEATSLSAIAAFQIPRIMGGLFLIGWIAGDIPALFALPAGLGDILAGIAGWQASRALAKGEPNARSFWRARSSSGSPISSLLSCSGLLRHRDLPIFMHWMHQTSSMPIRLQCSRRFSFRFFLASISSQSPDYVRNQRWNQKRTPDRAQTN